MSLLERWARCAHAALLVLVGAALLAGGLVLGAHGGSVYYLIAGLATFGAGVLTWRGDVRGAWLYGAMLVGTLGWAIWEAGFQMWGLVPRLALPVVLGLPFMRLWARGKRLVPVAAVAAAVLTGAVLHAIGPGKRLDPTLRVHASEQSSSELPQPLAAVSHTHWPHWGNDAGGTRFSPLSQITPGNVRELEVVWEADVGPIGPGPKAALQATPINVRDSLYLCNGYNVVIALDAETGRERWRYDMTRERPPSAKPCRGVSYYRAPDATGACVERILAVNQTPELIALDAMTGTPCADFGVDGRVSLLEGLGDAPPGYYYVSSPPAIVRGKAILGGAILDGQYWGEPSGVIRAFDAVTGRLAWAFDVGRPDRRGEPPSGETYTLSTPNSWAPISFDDVLGLVYLPTGNATPDLYAAQRRPFDDEISSAVIALYVETGERRWTFQTLHHDIWDYDVPSQPTLVDLPTSTGVRKALIQPTKRGEIFVLDRATGEPIREVRELPVPQGLTLPGERLSATQPFSVELPTFRAPTMRESDMWGMTPIDQMVCRILFRQSHYEGSLTPPILERPTLFDPGFTGGSNWGSVSVDVARGIMVVNWMRLPSRAEFMTRAEATARGIELFDASVAQGAPTHLMDHTPYAAVPGWFLSPLGMPCTAPPWGLLSAVDLMSGQLIWSKPIGTGRHSGPLGLHSQLPFTMGVPMGGGSMTTRTGLTFIGATVDSYFRAFDTATGELLWEADLPGAGMAVPMSYLSPGGRQIVVIAAGGRPQFNTRLSTKVVAYALPRE